jgi:hypothetical protein
LLRAYELTIPLILPFIYWRLARVLKQSERLTDTADKLEKSVNGQSERLLAMSNEVARRVGFDSGVQQEKSAKADMEKQHADDVRNSPER